MKTNASLTRWMLALLVSLGIIRPIKVAISK